MKKHDRKRDEKKMKKILLDEKSCYINYHQRKSKFIQKLIDKFSVVF